MNNCEIEKIKREDLIKYLINKDLKNDTDIIDIIKKLEEHIIILENLEF